MTPNQRRYIRELYRDYLPILILEYPRYDPYIAPWESILTSGEFAVWQDIRLVHLPFLPKFPVESYFIDFADPLRQIGVQVVHRGRGTKRRAQTLHNKSWQIYRIDAWRTRIEIRITPDGEFYCPEGYSYGDTSEGMLQQIKARHYPT
jgi:hypothetical protein